MLTNTHSSMSGQGGIASFERPIDLVHLARQTLGDRSLEQEILALYLKQARTLVERIGACRSARDRADFAHTLKGSSRAVGAWQVAEAAEAVEVVPPGASGEFDQAFARLSACVETACESIVDLQRTH